jgi:hypothetical protein
MLWLFGSAVVALTRYFWWLDGNGRRPLDVELAVIRVTAADRWTRPRD